MNVLGSFLNGLAGFFEDDVTRFQNLVEGMARELDAIPKWEVDALMASFRLPYQGSVFVVIVVGKGGILGVNVPSNACFPRGGQPAAAMEFVVERNHEQNVIRWDVLNLPENSLFSAKIEFPLRSVRSNILVKAAAALIMEVSRLDQTMSRMGYVR